MKKSLMQNRKNLVEKMTISTQTIEYDYSYEENDLVHLEMNLIELPFFNKNNKIKKNTSIVYNFNKDKTSYLQVKPGYDLCIPGEKEEKLFYALLKIFQKNNFLENKFCYTDYYEIIKEMELKYSGRTREQVKKGLEILRETHYEFQNSFYTKNNDEHHRVSFNELKKLINITFITLDKTSNEDEKSMFTNNRREIIKIELSDFIKNNILNKIFLYFSKQDLLSLENAVTRNIWIKFTKWRNGKLFLKISSKNIATKIPLSWTPSTYSKTIIIIKKALDDLKEKNLIRHYDFINMINDKKLKNEKTYFEIYFDEIHNEKRNNFSMGKNDYYFQQEYDTNIEHIEYKPSSDQEKEEKVGNEIKKFNDTVLTLYNMANEKGKKLKTFQGKIEKSLKTNNFEEVKLAILYANKNSKTSYGKYFSDTLEKRWYEDSKDELLSEYMLKSLSSSEIKEKLEKYGLTPAITYAKKNIYVSKEWKSTEDEAVLKLALETNAEYAAMIVKLLYSKVTKALTKPLVSIIKKLSAGNTLDDFMKKEKKSISNLTIEGMIQESKVQNKIEEAFSAMIIEKIPITHTQKDMGIDKIKINKTKEKEKILSAEDKDRALKYLREKEQERLNLSLYQKRCEAGLENSQDNIKLLLSILKKYDKKVIEIEEPVVTTGSKGMEKRQESISALEDILLKNENKIQNIKDIFDEELMNYENIFRKFTAEEKFKLKSITLRQYLEELKGTTDMETLKRIMSENIVRLLEL